MSKFVLEFTIPEGAHAEPAPVEQKSRGAHASSRRRQIRPTFLYRLLQRKVKVPGTLIASERPYSADITRRESLPFRVRLVGDAQDLAKAVEIRSSAYSRHLPPVGDALRHAEVDDHRDDVLILIAERKIDRRVVGSMRLQPNLGGPLRIEGEVGLPDAYKGRRLIEAMRLGVENGTSGRMVMVALVKAAYEICHATRIDFALVAGRRSVAAIYRSMLFDDVLGRTIPLSYAGNVQHSVLSIPIGEADQRWRASGHSLYDFMARTEHPDIQVDYERVFEAFRQA
jgi:hypothetical protein